MDVEEAKTKENPKVKIAEVVEDIDDTRENPEEIVRLMFDLFHEYGSHGIDDTVWKRLYSML